MPNLLFNLYIEEILTGGAHVIKKRMWVGGVLDEKLQKGVSTKREIAKNSCQESSLHRVPLIRLIWGGGRSQREREKRSAHCYPNMHAPDLSLS